MGLEFCSVVSKTTVREMGPEVCSVVSKTQVGPSVLSPRPRW